MTVTHVCSPSPSPSPTSDGAEKDEVKVEGSGGQDAIAVALRLKGRPESIPPSPSVGTPELPGKKVVKEYLWDRHWTENPSALEMMKPMRVVMKAPPLRQRLTQYHGTRVPVHMVFFIQTTELEQLGVADKFWGRIAKHVMVWRGLYCRDYDLSAGGARGRCVWRTLHGRAADDLCLFHMRFTHPQEFSEACKRITAIPGRSKEELLQSYQQWRERKKRRHHAMQLHAAAVGGAGADDLAATASSASSLPPSQPQAPGPVGLGAKAAGAAESIRDDDARGVGPWRAQCCSGLSARHARPSPAERLLSPVGRIPWKPRQVKVPKPSVALPLAPVRPPYSARGRAVPAPAPRPTPPPRRPAGETARKSEVPARTL